MDEQQLQQLAQAILAKDPKAIEAYKQLDPQTQKAVLAMVQQMEGGQGGQQISDEQLQQLAQGVLQNDPKAMEIAKQLPDDVKQRLVQMVQQLQSGAQTQGEGQGEAISPQVDQSTQQGVTQPQQPQMRYGGRMMLKCGAKIKTKMEKGGFMGINPSHKGYCTPMTKKTCTPRRKALAVTLKKHHGFHKSK